MNEDKYSDIIGMTRSDTSRPGHARMKTEDRAKLFAPFAALHGYDEAVKRKEASPAEARAELFGDAEAEIDGSLRALRLALRHGMHPRASVTYFSEKDGRRLVIGGDVTSVDGSGDGGTLTVAGKKIPFRDITEISAISERE